MTRLPFSQVHWLKLFTLTLPVLLLLATACSNTRAVGSVSDSGLSADPSVIDFGHTAPLDFSSNETIELTNNSSTPVTIEAIRIGEDSDAAFSLYQVPAELPITLVSGAAEVISAYFSPPSAGNFLGTIEVLTDDSSDPLLVLLGGCSTSDDCVVDFSDLDIPADDDDDDIPVGDDDDPVDPTGGDIETNPVSVNFGNVAQNQTPIGDVITIQNVGDGALVITDISISGSDASLFTFGGYAGGTIQASAAPVNLTLSFDPNSSPQGSKSATLTILSNDADEPSLAIPLTAEVTEDCGACLPEWTVIDAQDLGFDIGSLLGGGGLPGGGLPGGGLPGGGGGLGGGLPGGGGGLGGPQYLQVTSGSVDVLIQNTGNGPGTLSSVTEGGTLLGILPVSDSPQVTYQGGAPMSLNPGEIGTLQFTVSGSGMCEMINLDSSVTFIMGTDAPSSNTLTNCLDFGGLGSGGLPGFP